MNKFQIGLFLGLLLVVSCQKENAVKQVDDVCSVMDDIVFIQYCYDRFDANHDGKVSMEEAGYVHEIRVPYYHIYSLKGIEYFTQLKFLECTAIDIKSIDLSKNKELVELICTSCNLENLDLSHNLKLKSLNCADNRLSFLDVSKNTQLLSISCRYNKLTSIDVSKNTQLGYLICNPQYDDNGQYYNITPVGWKED